MILYNVTVKITTQQHDDWLAWMQEIHIPEVMNTGHFVEYRICRLLHNEEDGVTYAFQYFANSLADFQAYQEGPAQGLQEAHKNRFEPHYVAFRTLMEVLE